MTNNCGITLDSLDSQDPQLTSGKAAILTGLQVDMVNELNIAWPLTSRGLSMGNSLGGKGFRI